MTVTQYDYHQTFTREDMDISCDEEAVIFDHWAYKKGLRNGVFSNVGGLFFHNEGGSGDTKVRVLRDFIYRPKMDKFLTLFFEIESFLLKSKILNGIVKVSLQLNKLLGSELINHVLEGDLRKYLENNPDKLITVGVSGVVFSDNKGNQIPNDHPLYKTRHSYFDHFEIFDVDDLHLHEEFKNLYAPNVFHITQSDKNDSFQTFTDHDEYKSFYLCKDHIVANMDINRSMCGVISFSMRFGDEASHKKFMTGDYIIYPIVDYKEGSDFNECVGAIMVHKDELVNLHPRQFVVDSFNSSISDLNGRYHEF